MDDLLGEGWIDRIFRRKPDPEAHIGEWWGKEAMFEPDCPCSACRAQAHEYEATDDDYKKAAEKEKWGREHGITFRAPRAKSAAPPDKPDNKKLPGREAHTGKPDCPCRHCSTMGALDKLLGESWLGKFANPPGWEQRMMAKLAAKPAAKPAAPPDKPDNENLPGREAHTGKPDCPCRHCSTMGALDSLLDESGSRLYGDTSRIYHSDEPGSWTREPRIHGNASGITGDVKTSLAT